MSQVIQDIARAERSERAWAEKLAHALTGVMLDDTLPTRDWQPAHHDAWRVIEEYAQYRKDNPY